MRHPRLFVCVAAVAVVGAVTAFSAAATTAEKPWLRAVRTAPLVLKGGDFKPGEHVRVTLKVAATRFVRTATAAADGSFTARFGLMAVDPCRGAIVVAAVGSFGSRSSYRRTCRPAPTVPPVY